MTKNGAAQPANYSTALQLYYWKNKNKKII